MPTLLGADNFTHRDFTQLTLPTDTTRRIWSAIGRPAGITFDETKTRDGRGFMKIVEDGITATFARKALPAGTRTLVWSVYFIADDIPTVDSQITHASSTVNAQIGIKATTGNVFFDIGGATQRTFSGDWTDGLVHRLDIKFDTSGGTWTLDVSLDGTAGTQSTRTQAAADITFMSGGANPSSHTLTVWLQDLVWSTTAGDHPIGVHRVHSLNPNGDGTHASTIVAGDFDKASGADILTSTTDAWTEIDDWATGAADTTTYVQDSAAASTEYTEHVFENTAEATVWAACGYAACFASAATACELGMRVVDSADATVADILNVAPAGDDVSETTLRFWFKLLSTNPTATAVNGYKVRIGLSDDVAPDPRCSAVMVMIAVPGDPSVGGDATATPTTIATTVSIPAPTTQGTAIPTPSAVTVAADLPAPTVIAESPDVTVTPSTIAVVASLPAPTVSGSATTLVYPLNLVLTPISSTQIDLEWDAVTGAATYDIERDGAVVQTGVTGTTYPDTGLTEDTEYRYRVGARP